MRPAADAPEILPDALLDAVGAGPLSAEVFSWLSGSPSGGSVLLFDEADALFGRRTTVKDANDRF